MELMRNPGMPGSSYEETCGSPRGVSRFPEAVAGSGRVVHVDDFLQEVLGPHLAGGENLVADTEIIFKIILASLHTPMSV